MKLVSLFSNNNSQGVLAAIDRSMAVIEFDLSGTVLNANANFLETLGYTLDEILGKNHSIFVEPEADGMSWLHALLPSVEAHAIHGRMTAQGKALLAAQVKGEGRGSQRDDRTLDEIRADILCDLLLDGIVPAHPKDVQGIRPTVVVTVPALALLGADGDGPHARSVRGTIRSSTMAAGASSRPEMGRCYGFLRAVVSTSLLRSADFPSSGWTRLPPERAYSPG